LGADCAQAGRTGLLAGLQQDLEVESEAAAHAQHLLERGEVDGVLALVVGRPAAVPALPLDHDPPGMQSGPPPLLLAEDNVAVAVDEHGREVVAFVPLRDQERGAALGTVDDARRAAEPLGDRWDHLVGEVRPQDRSAAGILALRRESNPAHEVGEEPTGIKVLRRMIDDSGSCHHFPLTSETPA
jgi:hypothetical protein